MVPIIHPFDKNVSAKNVCVFVEGEAASEEAIKAGAYKAGGMELITEISRGRVDVVSVVSCMPCIPGLITPACALTYDLCRSIEG